MTKLYRTPQDTPTEPGWYYGQPRFFYEGKDAPYPCCVVPGIDEVLWCQRRPLTAFVWYGPVPECRDFSELGPANKPQPPMGQSDGSLPCSNRVAPDGGEPGHPPKCQCDACRAEWARIDQTLQNVTIPQYTPSLDEAVRFIKSNPETTARILSGLKP